MSASETGFSPVEARVLTHEWRMWRDDATQLTSVLQPGYWFHIGKDFDHTSFENNLNAHAYFAYDKPNNELSLLLISEQDDRDLKAGKNNDPYIYQAIYERPGLQLPLNKEIAWQMINKWNNEYETYCEDRTHSVLGFALTNIVPLPYLLPELAKGQDMYVYLGLRPAPVPDAEALSLLFYNNNSGNFVHLKSQAKPEDFSSPVPPFGQGDPGKFGLL